MLREELQACQKSSGDSGTLSAVEYMVVSCELPLLQPNSWHWESTPQAQLVLNMALKGYTQAQLVLNVFFSILPEKSQKPVRIYVQAPM